MRMSERYADQDAALHLTEGPAGPDASFPKSVMQAEAPGWLALIAIALFIGSGLIWVRIAECALHGGRF